jgi:transposase
LSLCPRHSQQIGQVAQDVDLIATAVRARASQAEPEAGTGSDGGLTSAKRREPAEQRRENRRLRGDVEILKRATAIFATAAR